MREPIIVSVVVPAFNSASTIRRTLDSLVAQTYTLWEAIVVDDGSSDDTPNIVAEYEKSDPRIVLLRQPHGGASASRNAGVAIARHPWLYFLDSDDWIHSTLLERLTSAVFHDANIDAAVCGWALVTADGLIITESRCSATADLFPVLARRCAFAIHACLVRRDLVQAAGGFDPAIRISQDWVLWQRVARLGARFGHVNETLAFYLQRQDSLSSDPVPLFDEAMSIIEMGHGPDPRIPDGPNAGGRPASELPGAQLNYLCFVAGIMLARERDPAPLLMGIARGIAQLRPSDAAGTLYGAVPAALGRGSDVWDTLWPRLEPHIDRFLDALERHMAALGHARATRLALERLVLDRRLFAGRTPPGGVTLGAIHAQHVEITSPIDDISVERGIERVRAHVALLGEPQGVIELPAFDGVVRSVVLRDAVADRFAWILLGRFFERTVYSEYDLRRDSDGWSLWHEGKCLAAALPDDSRERADALHDAVGWSIFLEELWKSEARPLPEPPRVESNTARAVATVRRWLRGATDTSDDWIVVQTGEFGVDIQSARPSVVVALRVGRSTLGAFDVPVHQGEISSAGLREWLTDAAGFELCRVAVREALIGTSWSDGGSLGDRLAKRAAASRGNGPSASRASAPRVLLRAVSFAPGWRDAVRELAPRKRKATVIARRAARPTGGSASRVAMLPGSLAAIVRDCEPLTGNPVVQIGGGEPSVVYAPSVVWRPLHPATPAPPTASATKPFASANKTSSRHDFEVQFARASDPWRYTSAYEVRKYEQTLSLLPLGPIASAIELGCAEGHFTTLLAARVERLVAADVSDIALERTAERCRGLTNVAFRRLDLTHDDIAGQFDLIVCSEVLYYVGGHEELAVVARRIAAALAPGGTLITAHANVLADDPGSPGYDWDLPFGARTVIHTFSAIPSLQHARELRTPLYRIAVFRATTDAALAPDITESDEVIIPVPTVAAHIVWNGRPEVDAPSLARPTGRSLHLPILMYHRVAPAGPPQRQSWRVTPEMFERQLRYLRECGFTSITLDDWRETLEGRKPAAERPIVITFDDGFADFAEHAWPILRSHDFGAMLTVVTGSVGGTNSWDPGADDERLLDWQSIARLHNEGVEIAAHSVTHRRMTALTPTESAREAIEARAALERFLHEPVLTFVYPFGEEDELTRHIVGAAGYAYALSCRPGPAVRHDPWLALPRIEVTGFDDLRAFIGKLAP